MRQRKIRRSTLNRGPARRSCRTLIRSSRGSGCNSAVVWRRSWQRKKKKNGNGKPQLKGKEYLKELRQLQTKLCRLQEWVKDKGLRVIIVFEGRDAAGKGGTIKAITERVSPRVFRLIALPAPSDREKTQMYSQRYTQHFPAAGEVVIFDRSWYNRAGVEYVMGLL
jgi:polyphosphate kinase